MGGSASRGGRKLGRPTGAERLRRREEILDAAVRLFLEHGFGGVTLDQLAAAAQVTKRTIYTYFGDKGEVFDAAVRRLNEQVLHPGAPADRELRETAIRLVRTLHADTAIGLQRLVIAEARQFPVLASGFYANGPQRYIEALTDLVAARTGLPAGPSAQRAEQLFSLLLGEPHRRRLLGLDRAPSRAQAVAHADSALAALSLQT
jgi:TetR/AcrR family transcriptional repressor of mexJK operon